MIRTGMNNIKIAVTITPGKGKGKGKGKVTDIVPVQVVIKSGANPRARRWETSRHKIDLTVDTKMETSERIKTNAAYIKILNKKNPYSTLVGEEESAAECEEESAAECEEESAAECEEESAAECEEESEAECEDESTAESEAECEEEECECEEESLEKHLDELLDSTTEHAAYTIPKEIAIDTLKAALEAGHTKITLTIM
jgi:hypothetical protein